MNRVWHSSGLMCLLLLSSLPALAGSTANVTVRVTINNPLPCEINNGRPIEVDFGDVMTTRVNGSNYREPIEYTLVCAPEAENAMKLQIQGSGAEFDAELLRTSNPNLGIKLQGVGGSFPLNSWMDFNYQDGKPGLWAVPVQKAGTTLEAGEFTATATMKIEYQ